MNRIIIAVELFLIAWFFSCGCQQSGPEAESCSDGIKNQNETGTDCGGICSRCQNGESCLVDSDCNSGNCLAGQCSSQGPSCDDRVQNQDETDVDCGGQKCTPCEEGKRCSTDDDCKEQLSCDQGTCVGRCVADCDGKCGGVPDDCGGTCEQCPAGQWCDAQECKVCNLDTHCGNSCADCSNLESNKACVNGSCGCAMPKDCKEGEICRNGTCFEQVPCTSPDGCPEGTWCSEGMCVPCDSDDHCGETCEDCVLLSKVCNMDGICSQKPCDGDTQCAENERCSGGVCICDDGVIECHNNVVWTCVDSSWILYQDCTERGMVCVLDHCEQTVLCPDGQNCANLYGKSQLYCLVDGVPPSGSQLGCDPYRPLSSCPSGFSCVDVGIVGIGPFCLERCGVCPDGLVCTDIDGLYVCMEPSGSMPQEAQTDCDESNPIASCDGNSLCLSSQDDSTFCLQVCSMPH